MEVSGHKDDLPDIAAKMCCQGAEILAGKFGCSERFSCRETCVKCLKENGDKPITLVSGTVVEGSIEQGVDVLVPSSQIGGCGCGRGRGPSNCIGIYPARNDILTVLILALPTETWFGIKDEKLSKEIYDLVSTENLPTLLQEEVLHLRRQLHILKRCQENKKLFTEALEGGTMEGFFKLISYYQTQSEPAYCGLASLAVVLNALAIDPGRTWKGPWRWFDDTMLDCCEPLIKIKEKGITFGKVACLAYCNGANVEPFRTNESSLDDFRRHVISSASSGDSHVITSYHRSVFKQTGTGHFSPIGGYHTGKDMVLILDVARFKYPPHWVPLTLLWDAMDTIDEATGHHRGFMIVSGLHKAPSILYTVSCRHEGWSMVAKYLTEDVPLRLKSDDVKDVENLLSIVFISAPADVKEFIKWVAEVRRQEDNGSNILSEEEKGRLVMKEEVLKQIRETELFKHVAKWLAYEISLCKDVTPWGFKETLPELAANICCQGAELLMGKLNSSDGACCRETNVRLLKADDEKSMTVVSGTITRNGIDQGIEMLVPFITDPSNLCDFGQSNCKGMHPSTADVLTVLLFALPQHTWSGIKEGELRVQFSHLASVDNLPSLLQQEVQYLHRQLHFLMTDLSAPSPSP